MRGYINFLLRVYKLGNCNSPRLPPERVFFLSFFVVEPCRLLFFSSFFSRQAHHCGAFNQNSMHTSCTLYSFTPYIKREFQDINKTQNKTTNNKQTKTYKRGRDTHSHPQCSNHNVYIYIYIYTL